MWTGRKAEMLRELIVSMKDLPDMKELNEGMKIGMKALIARGEGFEEE